MIWHPHTDEPGDAENALIAMRDEIGDLFLVGMAENVAGIWRGEETGQIVRTPFWWVDCAKHSTRRFPR